MDGLDDRAEVAVETIRSRIDRALLAVVVAVAAFLRFDRLGAPSYWLDEILGDQLTSKVANAPLWRWLTGLEREHGPLYYATQLAARLAGHGETTGRFPAALFGVATVAVVFLASRRAGAGRNAAIATALLLATSPLHVYYSREARPYALLMLLTAASIALLLRPAGAASGGVVIAAMLYTTAVAAPVVAAAAVVAMIAALMTDDIVERRRLWTMAAMAAAATLLFFGLYRGPAAVLIDNPFPRIDPAFVARTAREFTVSAFGVAAHERTVYLLLVLALLGAFALMRLDRRAAVVVCSMTVMPLLFAFASLRMLNHWYAVRYVAPALIGLVLLIGSGIGALGDVAALLVRSRGARIAGPLAMMLTLGIGVALAKQTWTNARSEPFQKLDWRAIGETIAHQARPGDVVLTAESWSDVPLRYYFRPPPAGVNIFNVSDPVVGEIMTQRAPAVWLVSAGYLAPTGVREWMCRYPLIMSSPLENFRLHYAPSVARFLLRSASATDLRAFTSGSGSRLHLPMGAGDPPLLGPGWGTSEGAPGQTFRWAIGNSASLTIPATGSHDRIIRFHALPFTNRELPPQRVRVLLNGKAIGASTMSPGWADYEFNAPADRWREGWNDLSFEFERSTAPYEISLSADRRRLAACLEWVTIEFAGAKWKGPPEPIQPAAVRLASDRLMVAKGVPVSERTHLPPGQLDRGEIESLLGRISFDPAAVWPRIDSGEIHVEDLVTTLAFGSECEDDATFVSRTFVTLAQRQPYAIERSDLLARLRAGAPRTHIVQRILYAGDLQARLLR